MREIPLTQGKYAIVDDDDYGFLKQDKWMAHNRSGNWYAETSNPNKKGGLILMHRVVMNAPAGTLVDHINGNGLDNRKSNLRFCTSAQNNQNRKKKSVSSSQYKSISWRPDANKWRAYIKIAGINLHLGYFSNEIDAARAYDKAAKQYFGRFARLNFPEAQ